jgi:hypothetical protein
MFESKYFLTNSEVYIVSLKMEMRIKKKSVKVKGIISALLNGSKNFILFFFTEFHVVNMK